MDQTEDRAKLLSYIPMANFIAQANGSRAEALIHDISDFNHSILYITPNNPTGRKVGGSLTDYAVRLVESRVWETTDYTVNYLGRSEEQGLILRSSTYFIKDGNRLIGLLCINVDITEQLKAAEIIERSLLIDVKNTDLTQATETFGTGADELIATVIAKKTAHLGNRKLSADENRTIIRELGLLDVFRLKGSVPAVSEQLGVSEQTVYRYIQELKKSGDIK